MKYMQRLTFDQCNRYPYQSVDIVMRKRLNSGLFVVLGCFVQTLTDSCGFVFQVKNIHLMNVILILLIYTHSLIAVV